jgi:hypothetical protein
MRQSLIVVPLIRRKHMPQMPLAENNDVIEAVPSDGVRDQRL